MRPDEPPAYHLIVVVDIERFGNPDRSDLHRTTAHNGLHTALRSALRASSIDPDGCTITDRGDGALILIPGTTPGSCLVDQWPSRLNAELLRYNAVCAEQARIRLRMSLHGGDARMAENGIVGNAVNFACRLVDTDQLREALREVDDLIAIIVSGTFYSEIVVNEPAAQPSLYRAVTVREKEVDTTAWIRSPVPHHHPPKGDDAAEGGETGRQDPWLVDTVDHGSLWPLVQAMHQVPFLAGAEGRDVLVRLLGDELRIRPNIRSSQQPIGHLLDIAEMCARHPDGPRALVEVLERVEHGESVARVRFAVHEMSVLELWPPEERKRLFALLSGVVVPEIAQIYQSVAGMTAPRLEEQTTYLDVFRNLERLNADPSGIPKPLLFVEHVATKVRAELAIELRRWSDDQATRFELRTELEHVRQNLRDTVGFSSPPPNPEAYLVIQLQREGPTGAQYRMSHWRQLDLSEGWKPIRGKDVTVHHESLKHHVAALIEKVEADWAQYQPDLRIEFVLDYENLSLDVDQWAWETDPLIPEPIGCRYLVAVRSKERMAFVKYHGGWRKRWAALRAQTAAYGAIPPLACRRHRSNGVDGLRELMSDFNRKPELVALVLNEPPQGRHAGGDEVAVGVRAGVPVIVWHRFEPLTRRHVDSVEDLLQNTDDEHHLLERARRARIVAFQEGPEGGHFGGGLTMVYDDPSRVVIPSQPAAPEEAPA
ncbi:MULTISPECIES: VMAP-C domain-containing protein [Amycolatopsis]|uniref:VMAP-C domain-containing protein n=1 Tax=Amycolatopsis sp. w19 TaxID=3448134 RepID=UPI003F1DC90F